MQQNQSYTFSVAPMIDWTDRFCRYFHRQLTKHARLYTEMIVDQAILRGDPGRLLFFDRLEHPVALQLGGSVPDTLAAAAKIGEQFGYDEINLNVGCPSDRVQSGAFGACLMKQPTLVADCVSAMIEAVAVPVTVKCRIGVDDQDPYLVLPDFIKQIEHAGCRTVIVHARKAWLNGLSPKQNRTVPPLDYDLIEQIKKTYTNLSIVLNGGIEDINQSAAHLARFDGVMLGRAAYERPYTLAKVDKEIFGDNSAPLVSRFEAVARTAAHFDALDVPLWRYARHMLGLFHGETGARRWRQVISADARRSDRDGAWLTELAGEIADIAHIDEGISV